MDFTQLGLPPSLKKALDAQQILEPTPIQAEVFDPICNGKSVMALSKTGSGKTLAYLTPICAAIELEKLIVEKTGAPVLVLLPTRELALQVQEELDRLGGEEKKYPSSVIVGGEAESEQIRLAERAVFLLATPGRMLDLLRRRQLHLKAVTTIIFDEADRLLDMGFVQDIRDIVQEIPNAKQMLFFSATLHLGVEEMAYEMGVDFERFGSSTAETIVDTLEHKVVFVGDKEKFHLLAHLLKENENQRGIVFSNFKDKARQIAGRLRGLGLEARELTSQLSQAHRKQILKDFKEQKIRVLVASDLAARGIDVLELDYVINFDLPEDSSIYVHRVGRTARAGRSGKALSFVGFEDSYNLERLETYLKKKIEVWESDPDIFKGPFPQFGPRIEDAEETRPQRGDRDSSRSRRDRSGRNRSNRPERTARPDRPERSRAAPTSKEAPPRIESPQRDQGPKKAVKPVSLAGKLKRIFLGLFGIKDVAPKDISSREHDSNRSDSSSRRRRSGKGRYNKGSHPGGQSQGNRHRNRHGKGKKRPNRRRRGGNSDSGSGRGGQKGGGGSK